MDNENLEIETPTNENEETVETEEEGETPNITPEEIAELKKKAELADNYKVRAEKAESKLKKPEAKPVKEEPKESETQLSSKDTIVLISSGVTHEEDIDEVAEYASWKGISIAEALKSPAIKATLDSNKENRLAQEATSTGKTPRGEAKVSNETILADAEKGKLPEKPEDIERLVDAHLASKQPKKK